jgi:hypothetical protein
MATQLVLLDIASPDWKLDRETRETGRRGVAQARAALRTSGNGTRRPPARSVAA